MIPKIPQLMIHIDNTSRKTNREQRHKRNVLRINIWPWIPNKPNKIIMLLIHIINQVKHCKRKLVNYKHLSESRQANIARPRGLHSKLPFQAFPILEFFTKKTP